MELPKPKCSCSKQVFAKKPKEPKNSKPKPKCGEKEEESLFDATKDIKRGALRRALHVEKDYKFKRTEVLKLLKTATGDKFKFQGREYKMTEKLRKQLQLAANFLK